MSNYSVLPVAPKIHLRTAMVMNAASANDAMESSVMGTGVGSVANLVSNQSNREMGLKTVVALNHISLCGKGVSPEMNIRATQVSAPNK